MDKIKSGFKFVINIFKNVIIYLWLFPVLVYLASTRNKKDFKNSIVKMGRHRVNKKVKLRETTRSGENVVVKLKKEQK